MATHTTTRYTCDLCGGEMGGPYGQGKIKGYVYPYTPNPQKALYIDYPELCCDCGKDIRNFLQTLINSRKETK